MTGTDNKRIGWRRALALAGILAITAAAWTLLAPPLLGGSVTYVVTAGTSMEPGLHAGDLVLVRETGDYRAGDVAAYRSSALESLVLHRIVETDRDRYLFKGDNNSWLDEERPDETALVGKLWLHIPGAGKFLALRSPITIAILAATAALILVGGGGAAAKRRRNRSRRAEPTTSPASATVRTQIAPRLLTSSALALAASLALAALAYSRDGVVPEASDVSYTHTGAFGYSAAVKPGPVYPGGRVETGDPVFLRLVDEIDVRFTYRLTSDAPRAIAGTAALTAELSETSGWKRTLELQTATRFDGDTIVLAGTLDLARLRKLQQAFEAATGLTGSYLLTLVPTVEVDGTLAGAPLEATFSPPLEFALNGSSLTPKLPAPGTASPDEVEQSDPLAPEETASLERTAPAPATLSAAMLRVDISTARQVAIATGAASLAGLLLAALLLLRGRRASEPERIQAKFRNWLIPVSRSDRRAYDEIVEVTTMETLARLAERYDRMILHEQSELGHSYRVADDSVLYVYLVGEPNSDGLLPPLPIITSPAAETPPGEQARTPTSRPVPVRRRPLSLASLLGKNR